MIATLLTIYMLLNYVYEMEKEQLFKLMLMLCMVNFIPIIIYIVYSSYYGELDATTLILMTLI